MSTKKAMLAARSRIGVASRHSRGGGKGEDARLRAAYEEFEGARLAHAAHQALTADPPVTTDGRAEVIATLVAAAPPLTDEQTERIVTVLRGGGAQ